MTFILGSSTSGRLSYDFFGEWDNEVNGTLSSQEDAVGGMLAIPGVIFIGGGAVADVPTPIQADLEVD